MLHIGNIIPKVKPIAAAVTVVTAGIIYCLVCLSTDQQEYNNTD
jgi:hypothetical protein